MSESGSRRTVTTACRAVPRSISATGPGCTALYEEPRMLVVPRGHPLADRASVTAEELAGEEAAPCPFETVDWTSYRILGAGVPPIESCEDKLELVADGKGKAIAVLPVGDRRSSLRPDLVTVPTSSPSRSRALPPARSSWPAARATPIR
ncbi:LysR substrate-binding domain-containing protein [Streptomyces sp. HNM0645]|uniref:LysR substrate-binding domain-containing protein n=1 Tax=Streptomyces sp. HNM0645 TaxID=2782343 RepID=UPI0024B636B6|nr:LysR substrate-binding domain-containing protein [Streptomyces sp. HNM0645]MDI9888374.1 LysR substrate-binding domain-containing protein [Streptomyces sp. HNM0645]